MFASKSFQSIILIAGLTFLLFTPAPTRAQQNQVMGQLRFSAATNTEKRSGVWIDGQYVGFVQELKGDKKIMLLPGEHAISVRQAGFTDFAKTIVVEPARLQTLYVRMKPDPRAFYPGADAAELKLDIKPERAAVFVDDGYVGHVADVGGAFRAMTVTPGKHRVKVELPGYQTFETEVNLLPKQKSKVETDLVEGSILQAGPLIQEQ